MNKKFVLTFLLIFILASFVSAECIDSDSGLNYYEAGNVRLHPEGWKDSNGFSELLQGDYCKPDKITLSETYCDENGNSARVEYSCPKGCWSTSLGDVCIKEFDETNFSKIYSADEMFVLRQGETAGFKCGNNIHSLTLLKASSIAYLVLDNPSKKEYEALVGTNEAWHFYPNNLSQGIEVLDIFECVSGIDNKGYSIIKDSGAVLKISTGKIGEPKNIDLSIEDIELGIDGDLISSVKLVIKNNGLRDYVSEISNDRVEVSLIYSGVNGINRFALTQLSPKDYCNSSSSNFVLKSDDT
jgi:hypothetical protein